MERRKTPKNAFGGPADLVVVAHPDDEVLEFFSILTSENGSQPALIVCTEGTSERKRSLAEVSQTLGLPQVSVGTLTNHSDGGLDLGLLRKFLVDSSPANLLRVWTHSPADDHPDHCQVARAVSLAFPETRIFYAHGVFNEYQFVAEVCNPLSLSQVEQKMALLNTYYQDQIEYDPCQRSPGFTTRSVLSVERFVTLSQHEVSTLFWLRRSRDIKAALEEEPWGMRDSDYEHRRIDATIQWLKQWINPEIHSFVEVGACEGIMSERILSAGFRNFTCCEPNAAFRARLEKRLMNTGISVRNDSVESLCASCALPADFYVLSEMLSYVPNLDLLNGLPTNSLLITVHDRLISECLEPWLQANNAWRIGDRRPLVHPQLEFCCGNKAYRRKEGSSGVVLYRNN